MTTVEFNEKGIGKWADTSSQLPQFVITEAGQTHKCSHELADIIEAAGKGKAVKASPAPVNTKEKLTAEATQLISDLGLDVADHNLGLDVEGLQETVANLSKMKEDKAAEDKTKPKKTPATKDKKGAESK